MESTTPSARLPAGCPLLSRRICFLSRISFLSKTRGRGELTKMKTPFLRIQSRVRILLDDSGQDLIEYALVVALVAFGATVGMGTLANGINNAFSTIASRLSSA